MVIRKPILSDRLFYVAHLRVSKTIRNFKFYLFEYMRLLTFLISILLNINVWAQQTLIQHVQIIDGTGKSAYSGSVRIQGNIIQAVGLLTPEKSEKMIDGQGYILSPGFIDSHSHHLGDVLQNPDAISTASQGITTIIVGQDGESYPIPTLEQKLKKTAIAVNVGTYTGQTSLRSQVMGDKNLLRKANQIEVDAMKALLKKDLKLGSFGLSTGLEYESAFYSSRDEVLQLAQVAANQNARYISHIRSEDITMDDALNEIIEIGQKTLMPVQISHIKLAKKDDWGTAKAIISRLEEARKKGINITADIYPYTFWHSTPRILFPNRDYDNLVSAQFAVDQLFDPSESYLVKFAPNRSYEGKTFHDIASIRHESDAETLRSLVALAADFRLKYPNYEGTIEAMTGKSMLDQDVIDFMQWEHSNICSDGNAGAHPRGFGSFTRVLGRYVREQKIMPWETAIYKMTGLTAKHLGIKDRGIIAPGKKADLVLINPNTVIDRAVIGDSRAISVGIEGVWVNGSLVYSQSKSTGKRSGQLIKR
jgi:N-acyl-D-aspartate/D-glutamate deacylase